MEIESSIEIRIARRLAAARIAAGLTLDDLAKRSGVSRAMISRIEREEASPTAGLLVKLTNALGFGLSALFAPDDPAPPSPLVRAADQATWQDPETGYVRRNVSPRGFGAAMEIVEVTLPPDKAVQFDNTAPLPLAQFVWLFSGHLVMTANSQAYQMAPGDCLHMTLSHPVTFRNPGPLPAHYAVVIETPGRRRTQELS